MIDIRKFWNNEKVICEIRDMPGVMCNGFLLDFRSQMVLDRAPMHTYDSFLINLTDKDDLLTLVSQAKLPTISHIALRIPYLYDFEARDGRHVFLQKPYVEYFRRRYDGCQFYTDSQGKIVAVRLGNEIVGAIASLEWI